MIFFFSEKEKILYNIISYFDLNRGSIFASWVWCNIFLAPVIFFGVDIYYAAQPIVVTIVSLMIVQVVNLIYIETNRVLFIVTFGLNGFAALFMGKPSIFYAVLSLHHWHEYHFHREWALDFLRHHMPIWVKQALL